MTGFDPAAEFLLDWEWPNLFDPTADTIEYRCKGCGEIVLSWERVQHHSHHRRQRRRDERRRASELRRTRISNLAKARAAKTA